MTAQQTLGLSYHGNRLIPMTAVHNKEKAKSMLLWGEHMPGGVRHLQVLTENVVNEGNWLFLWSLIIFEVFL